MTNISAELLLALAVLALTIFLASGRLQGRRKAEWWARPKPLHSADQLQIVMTANFAPKKIMNGGEYRVFRIVEAEIAVLRDGHRVFAQTALGEVLSSADPRVYATINSKRVDMLVIGPTGMPRFAVEFQGKGHYQNDAVVRDAVKKEALRRAGIGYVEVLDTDTSEHIRQLIHRELARSQIDRAVLASI